MNVPPGGMIMIHGLRNGIGWIGRLHLLLDWTDGCIAVTNPSFWNSPLDESSRRPSPLFQREGRIG